MKKTMMMTAAAFLMAATVQASSLTWGTLTPSYGLYDSAGVLVPKSSSVQLVLALLPSSGYDVTTGTLADFQSSIKSTANTSTKTAGSVVGTLGGITSSGAIYQMYALVGGNYYKVLDMTTSSMVASYTISGVSSGTETIGTTYQPSSGLVAHALKIDSTGMTFVPEPTSMALLALGAAVLGLRRKNRK